MGNAVKTTQDLVAIPSVNPMGDPSHTSELYSEAGVAAYVSKRLREAGLTVEVQGTDEHPNIVSRIAANRSETLLLTAHMDTVSHLNMSISPFDPSISEGKLWGRGSCDTKASLAVFLETFIKAASKPEDLGYNLVFAAVHDEEFSFGGSKTLVENGLEADWAITGEPTSLNIIYSHKGVCRFKVLTTGKSSHAAMPWLGANAIYKMSPVIAAIEEYASSVQKKSHADLGPATANLGIINGGTTVNTVPDQAFIEVDRRLLPDELWEDVRNPLVEMLDARGANAVVQEPFVFAPGVWLDQTSRPPQALLAACLTNGVNSEFATAHYGTDGCILSAAGIPTLVFGPGDVSLAHTQAEFVPVDEIETAEKILSSLVFS